MSLLPCWEFVENPSFRAAPPKICGLLAEWLWITSARHAALMIGIPMHSWPCAEESHPIAAHPVAFVALCGETRTKDGVSRYYEVQARQRRAYSPSAATNS